jgi:Carboxypeptidase regulatory-like domain/Putative binding domain, N-terminal
MRRYLPLCLLVTLLPLLTGCGESPNSPSVVTETPRNPPKTNARFIQVPWDISLFFNLPGGAVVAGATTAATNGAAAPGDNLTGTFVNSNGFAGTISGVLTGNLEGGNFDGTLSTITRTGCTAERRFSGPITSQALNWSPGAQINDCGGASPLTSGIQVTAAPPTAPPPCTYDASATGTSVPSGGGTGTVSVTAGEGCNWFATSSADFVTLSASQGTAAGSVQFTVAANTTTAQRTATLVVAGTSFTITQAPAPVCTYRLNGRERTFDASGALGGVDMRVAAGCAWQAQSDAPWLTITSGASGSGDGTISYAVAANPSLTQRVGRITATRDEAFTVTQLGIVCQFTVTPSTTSLPFSGGSGTIQVGPNAAVCPWTATVPAVTWITLTPAGGTGQGSVAFTVAANPDPVARTGVVIVAGREIAITQAPAPCVFTLTPSTTSVPFTGGAATIGVATHAACAWTAAVSPNAPWITVAGGGSGSGNGTVTLNFAANPTAQQRTGIVTVGTATVTFTQAPTTQGSLTGVITNSLNGQAISGATVTLFTAAGAAARTATTTAVGGYTFSNVEQGTYNILVQMFGFGDARGTVTITAAQTTPFNAALVPNQVNLTLIWNPSPAPAENSPCSELPGFEFCWRSTLTISETSGTAATVGVWTVNFYNAAGALIQTIPRTGADFADPGVGFGVNPIPGGGTISRGRVFGFNSGETRSVEYVFAGTDAFGRTFAFTTPRLTLNAVPGTSPALNAVPAGPSGGADGAALRGASIIRRR